MAHLNAATTLRDACRQSLLPIAARIPSRSL
jgi:hypothetical protein